MEAGGATSRRARYRTARVPAPCPRIEGRATIWQVRDGPTVHAAIGAQEVRRNRMRAHRRSIRLLPAFTLLAALLVPGLAGSALATTTVLEGTIAADDGVTWSDGRGGGRDPRRHVGEAGGRGHPRAAADRRPGCRAHRLRGPVRRRASRSEGRLWRLRDHCRWGFGLRDATSGARADRRARHGRGARHRGGPGLSGEHHRFRDATGGRPR